MKKFLLLCFSFAFVLSAWAQERVVSGKITAAEDGTTLPGVNVVLKGTTTGTVTDVDGNFRLGVPSSGGTLVFSFIGLQTQEIAIGDRSIIDIRMGLDVQQLTEVVVTAVGIERERKALGYAVSELAGDKIRQKSEPDIVRSLQGKVAGVNIIGAGGAVGEGTNITIRGNSSLLGNNQPLFVVDGVPFDNSTYTTGSFTSRTTASNRSFDLDPNNIESMTVLKGAAAAALYGSRAANGVIVVTTKSGSGKATKKGLEITLTSGFSAETVANLPDYQQRYVQGNNFKYVDGNFGTWGASFDPNQPEWLISNNANLIKSIDPTTGKPWVSHPYDRYTTASSSPFFGQKYVGDSVLLSPHNTPKDFFQTGSVFETGLSVSGGNQTGNITAGVSRSRNEGITPFNIGTRTSVNIGGNMKLDNGLYVGGSASYVRNELTSPPSAGLFTGGTSITERLLYTPPNVDVKGLPSRDPQGNSAFYRPDNDNPYFLAEFAPQESNVDRYFGNLYFGYDLTDWLNVTLKGGFNSYSQQNFGVLPISTNAAPTGQITDDRISNREADYNLIFTATKDISADLNLKAILGGNLNKRTTERQAYQGTGIIVRGLNDLDNTQSVLPFGGGITERGYEAVFTDLTFGYKDYLFLNLTGRNDWTSTLPVDQRSYFYGGASSSFIFSDAFDISNNWFSYGKLRAGFARVGNDTQAYLTQQVNFFTNNSLGNNIAAFGFPYTSAAPGASTYNVQSIGQALGNPQLTPEFTTEWEIGADLRFLNNRVGLELTYYDRSSTDQIVSIPIPRSSGFDSKTVNIGEVTNSGIEAALDITPVQLNNSFRWNIFSVFTRNRNEVVSLTEGLDEVFVAGFGNSVQVAHAAGQPYGQLKGQTAERDAAGNLLVDPSTGKLIIGNDLEFIGDPNPDYQIGITNTFSFKGISLNFLIDYRHGGDMYSGTYNQLYGRGLTPGTIPDGPNGRRITLVIPGVVGDPTTQQAVLDENGNSIPNGTQLTVNDWFFINTFASSGGDEFSVFDASTIRLRELSIGYDLPKSLLSRTPFGSASITFTGRNLWYKALNFPSDLNFDPETSSLGAGNIVGLTANPNQSGNSQGVDFGVIPTTKRFGVNLKLTF
ncbi:MAG: SusC/RagA family TonB-linked outer membrane protein [Cyclobacteriaceae bacterium]